MPVQFPPVIELSDLNGKNGFMIDGITANDESGCSVSAAGDINDDGVADLIVGADRASPNGDEAGQTYVIFGSSNVGSIGTVQLSSLNGVNGFIIDGIAAGDRSGISVSGAGDINADGVADLVIGGTTTGVAHEGSSFGQGYVIFGGRNIGSTGTIQLSSLNGANGFRVQGISIADYEDGAFSVSGASDINDDGIADLVIGASHASPNARYSGQSYVLFGGSSVGSTGIVKLSSLNGTNGFRINGIAVYDYSGYSVSAAGDINGDGIADLIVGAPGASPNGSGSGQSYVLFGARNLGSTGTFELYNLNGTNGFAINGIAAYDGSGHSVSTAGDINGDGVTDLVIGAHHASPNGKYSGQSYVLFGGSNVGNTGTVQLSSLNGSNGFAIDGIAVNDYSGRSVSAAGDINADGVSDLLIGADGADSNGNQSGQSYVLFGNGDVGSTGTIQLSSLNGTNGFAINGIAAFDSSGYSVSAADDINTDGLADLVIGAVYASPNGQWSGQSYVIFGENFQNTTMSILLNNNQLSLIQGQTVVLTSANLQATSNIQPTNTLQFFISGIQHGQFTFVENPNVPINLFCQQDIIEGQIQFIHDGTSNPPSYTVNAQASVVFISSTPVSAIISFNPCNMILINNGLTINQAQTIVLDKMNFYASSDPCPQDGMQFQVQNIAFGQFEFLTNPSLAITIFSQQNVTDGAVQFVQDGTSNAPSYSTKAYISDYAATGLEPAMIKFGLALVNNGFTINQGGTVILTSSNLLAVNGLGIPNDQIIFQLIDIYHATFTNRLNPWINSFTQAEINANQIQFVTDGTPNVPMYSFTVTDGNYTLPIIQNCNITFHYEPTLTVNALSIKEGATILLNNKEINLKATDRITPASDLIFSISALKYGYFELVSNPSEIVTNFTQGQVDNIDIQFVQDGSPNAPSYNVSVINQFGAISKSQAAIINFNPNPSNNTAPPSPPKIIFHDSGSNNNLTRNILIGTLASAGVLSAIAIYYISMGYLKNSRLNAVAKNKSSDEKEYYQHTIIPVAKEIFDTIKITGLMNYISQEKIKEYVAAIAKVVHEMSELGINIDLQDMPAEQKTLLVNQMILEMKRALNITKQRATHCSGFFKPQVTSEQIMEQAKAIATSIREALFSGVSDTRINLPPGMESWQMSGKSNQQSGERTPLLSA